MLYTLHFNLSLGYTAGMQHVGLRQMARAGICKVAQWASPYYFSGSNAPFHSKIEHKERNGS